MRKQIFDRFDRIRKTLAIFLLVSFVASITVASVSAQPSKDYVRIADVNKTIDIDRYKEVQPPISSSKDVKITSVNEKLIDKYKEIQPSISSYVHADFTVAGRTTNPVLICPRSDITYVQFIDKSTGPVNYWKWIFSSDKEFIVSYDKNPIVGLTEGTYDVILLLYCVPDIQKPNQSESSCFDSETKKKYVSIDYGNCIH